MPEKIKHDEKLVIPLYSGTGQNLNLEIMPFFPHLMKLETEFSKKNLALVVLTKQKNCSIKNQSRKKIFELINFFKILISRYLGLSIYYKNQLHNFLFCNRNI